jgi:shikimate dehydrogenase
VQAPVSAAGTARQRLGVLGWPVAHSRSPAMHNAAFAALGMDGWRYQRLPVPPALFAETVRALGGAGFLGANVTIPHKQAALALADGASVAAREIGAANTLSFAADGAIAAENTDAPGLIEALPLQIRGRSALVLGAGGSARAAVWALLRAGAEVSVWNRTPQRAARLAAELGARAVRRPQPADLLVNCTSVGLHGLPESGDVGTARLPDSGSPADTRVRAIPDSASEAEALNQLSLTVDQLGGYPHVVDLVYSNAQTPLLAVARRHGAVVVDGVEMLLSQGAISFRLWTGVDPPREVMRAAAATPSSRQPQARL